MASRKRKKQTPSKTVIKKVASQTVKRPKRGYHTFKNGILNASPKGGEVELVKINQRSPLLRLPPEIRTKIWDEVLGNKIITHWYLNRYVNGWRVPESKRKHCLALLRTCRQIFHETALIPHRMNTFYSPDLVGLYSQFRRMKTAHRREVASVRIGFTQYHYESWLEDLERLLPLLPGLQRIKVVLWYNTPIPPRDMETRAMEKRVREALKAWTACFEVTIEQQDMLDFFIEAEHKGISGPRL